MGCDQNGNSKVELSEMPSISDQAFKIACDCDDTKFTALDKSQVLVYM